MFTFSAIAMPAAALIGMIIYLALNARRHSPKTEVGIDPTPIKPVNRADERHPMRELENVIVNVRWPINK